MAARGPSKARDLNYANVGKAGRRTGLTLKEGRRDEHGMEEIDGMFSSPEKSPVRTNGGGMNETMLNSEDMDTGGSIPDPAELRRAGRNSFLLPPRSRSPVKTFMSGSPRRTPGIRSSPMPQSDQLSSPSSRHAAKRALDFSAARSRLGPDTQNTDGRGKGGEFNAGEDTMAEFSDEESHLPEQPDEIEGLTHMEIADDQDQGSDEAEAADDEEGGYEDPDSPLAVASASGRGRKRKNTSPPVPDVETSTNPGPKKRGRKPKAAAQQADVEQAQASRPSKKAKTSQSKSREGNVDLSVEQESQLNRIVDNYAKRNGPLDKNRSLCILRRESPSGDTVKHTRSGRVSVRPLAYWRNEKIVFGGDDVETGQRYPVSTIKEVIRTEEEEASWVKKKGKRGAKKKSKSRKNRDSPSDDEDDEHAEPWETDGGVFYGAVKAWDPELQAPVEEEELTDLSYAPLAIQTHEVKNSSFRFAKVLSKSFLGAGVVEMPPGSVKRQKNSKKMHMVFFVYRGRIHVEIAGHRFSAGKGSVFQVPRGNNYSFDNDYDTEAAIFFTQGCIPLDEEGNIDLAEPPLLLPDPASLQEMPPDDKPKEKANPPKKRGRPKQASKA